MSLIKVLGALESPNGITSHSKRPSFVLKAVFHSSPGLILIWRYPLLKSILEKISAPPSWSRRSLILGMGNLYFTAILLIALLSTHILQLPSFFGVNKAETAHGLKLG